MKTTIKDIDRLLSGGGISDKERGELNTMRSSMVYNLTQLRDFKDEKKSWIKKMGLTYHQAKAIEKMAIAKMKHPRLGKDFIKYIKDFWLSPKDISKMSDRQWS